MKKKETLYDDIMIPHWIGPWIAASGFVVAAFLAWRDERRAKEKALTVIAESQKIPQCAGLWRRADGLTARIDQDGNRISSKFSQGNYDHMLGAHFDPSSRRFISDTVRTNTKTQGRTVMSGCLILLDENTLVFINRSTDGLDDLPSDYRESGILEKFKG